MLIGDTLWRSSCVSNRVAERGGDIDFGQELSNNNNDKHIPGLHYINLLLYYAYRYTRHSR